MRKITLAKAWSYVTPQKTIDFGAGDHDVSNEVAAKAEAEGVISGSEPSAGPTDALDGTIDDLTAHVAGVTDAAEIQRLIDAEVAGKSRKGALDVLEARQSELAAAQ